MSKRGLWIVWIGIEVAMMFWEKKEEERFEVEGETKKFGLCGGYQARGLLPQVVHRDICHLID